MAYEVGGARGSTARAALVLLKQKNLFDRVAAQLGSDKMRELESVVDSAWVPFSIYLPFVEAILSVVGSEQAYIDFWREHIRSYLDSPLITGLVGTARKLFGLTPVAAFKVLPRGWQMTYRGAGQVEVESAGKTATFRASNIPASVLESPAWAVGHVGTLQGLLAAFAATATAKMTERAPERGRFTIQITWS